MVNLFYIEMMKQSKRKFLLYTNLFAVLIGILYSFLYRNSSMALTGQLSYHIMIPFCKVFQLFVLIPAIYGVSSDITSGYIGDLIAYGYQRRKIYFMEVMIAFMNFLFTNFILMGSIFLGCSLLNGLGNVNLIFWIQSALLFMLYLYVLFLLGFIIAVYFGDLLKITVAYTAFFMGYQILFHLPLVNELSLTKFAFFSMGDQVFYIYQNGNDIKHFLLCGITYLLIFKVTSYLEFCRKEF